MDDQSEVALENICVSGGADGSDLQWGMMAGRNGHMVVHYSFQGHRTEAPEDERVVLGDLDLSKANDALMRANDTLGRRFPSTNPDTTRLLQRNWYQIKDAEAIYALGTFDTNLLKRRIRQVDGGTAWAIQMYMDRFAIDKEPVQNCKLYFYDQTTCVWWHWVLNSLHWGEWKILGTQPPAPKGVWAGIGTRDLTLDGKWAIRKLMGGFPVGSAQIASLYPTVTEPKVGDKIFLPTRKLDDMTINGGWATVNRIQSGTDDMWISVYESMTTFRWSELAPLQESLREEFGLTHALTK